jgi:hypothetical protein
MRYKLMVSIFFVIVFSSIFLVKIARTDQALPLANKKGFNMKLVEDGRYLIKIAGATIAIQLGICKQTARYLLKAG